MHTSVLAHGGQITGDEMAIIGGGIFFALMFPILALVIAMRRTRRHAEATEADDVSETV